MSNKTEVSTQTHDNSLDAIDLRLRLETKMNSLEHEFSINELTLRSVDERSKQVTDPILRQI